MKKKLIFFAFWLMVCIGLKQEFYTYTSDHMTGTEYGIALYCSLLLLLYIVPAAFALRYLQKKWNLQPRLIWLSLTAGAFISGWLAAYGNDGVDWFLDLFIKNKEMFDTLGALSAPIIEEPIKLFAASAIGNLEATSSANRRYRSGSWFSDYRRFCLHQQQCFRRFNL